MLELAGVAVPTHVQGRSFASLLHGETLRDWPHAMYYRYWMHNDGSHGCPAHYGVRTRTHKLICYYNDPLEVHNIDDHPDAEHIRAELLVELTRLHAELGDTPYIGAR